MSNEEPQEAGGVDAAMQMFESMDSGGGAPLAAFSRPDSQPKPQPEQQPEQQPAAPASGGPMLDPPASPPGAQPVVDVPDHVVRKGDKAIATWKQLYAELDSYKSKVVEIEQDRELKDARLRELEEQLGKAPKEADLEAARKRAAELEDELGKIDVARSPRFQEMYEKPIRELFGKVVQQFMKAGHPQELAVQKARLVFKPGMQDPQALAQVLEDESSLVVGAVSALLDEREVLAQRREDALENWRQEQAAGAEDMKRREAATISEQLNKHAAAGFGRALKEGSWLYKEGVDDNWNNGVKARKDAVMGFIRGGKPDELAYLVAEGVAAPTYRQLANRYKAEADDLRDQLARVGGNRPGIGYSSAPPAASGAAPQQPAPTSFRDVIDREWSDM